MKCTTTDNSTIRLRIRTQRRFNAGYMQRGIYGPRLLMHSIMQRTRVTLQADLMIAVIKEP
jgi:hypothetical protein